MREERDRDEKRAKQFTREKQSQSEWLTTQLIVVQTKFSDINELAPTPWNLAYHIEIVIYITPQLAQARQLYFPAITITWRN